MCFSQAGMLIKHCLSLVCANKKMQRKVTSYTLLTSLCLHLPNLSGLCHSGRNTRVTTSGSSSRKRMLLLGKTRAATHSQVFSLKESAFELRVEWPGGRKKGRELRWEEMPGKRNLVATVSPLVHPHAPHFPVPLPQQGTNLASMQGQTKRDSQICNCFP